MLQELGNALSFLVLAGILPVVILTLLKYFRPSLPHAGKMMTYECGEIPRGSAYLMFNDRFYLVAICFLVFDVEVALLFPVLVLFKDSIGTPAATTVFLLSFAFIFVLLVGLIYEWKKGDIDWIKDVSDRRKAFANENKGRAAVVQNSQA